MANVSAETSHQGFLRHRDFRWAKVALLLCAASIAAYVWHDAPDGPNGGTWLGYTLGGIGAALVLFLLWLGVRKRRYRSTLGTLRGWTSAHIYFGLALIVIASLHCGFQYGLNVHTLAYGLMVIVVLSGTWGLIAYEHLPSKITQLRDGSTREAWIDEVFDLNEQAIKLSTKMAPDIHQRVVGSAEKLRLGGSLRAQWRGSVTKDNETVRMLLEEHMAHLLAGRDKPAKLDAQSTVMFMAGMLQQASPGEAEAQRVQQLLELLTRRNALIVRINRDIALHARLQLWLLFHVPLSFGLLAALIAHVFSVFFYW